MLCDTCQIRQLSAQTIWADWWQTMTIMRVETGGLATKADSMCRMLSMSNKTQATAIQFPCAHCKTIFSSAWTGTNWPHFATNQSKIRGATILPSNALATGVEIFAGTAIAKCSSSTHKLQISLSLSMHLIQMTKTFWRFYIVFV